MEKRYNLTQRIYILTLPNIKPNIVNRQELVLGSSEVDPYEGVESIL